VLEYDLNVLRVPVNLRADGAHLFSFVVSGDYFVEATDGGLVDIPLQISYSLVGSEGCLFEF
jgi:hypothetical protein